MLANGATLGYKKKTGSPSTYTDLPGLKEIPEMGIEAEKVENSGLTDGHKMYELGVGDLPDMVYKFKYDNTKADSPYRVMVLQQIRYLQMKLILHLKRAARITKAPRKQ